MKVPDDMNNVFPGILQTLADLISQHRDIRELDGRTLSQCDEALDALRSVQKQLERRVALVSQQRNTFAPVNALPPELLVTIFEIVIDSEPAQVWSDIETLMLVCHHWNHLLHNTPSLWTKIQVEVVTPYTAITHALEMSQESPLEINYNGTGPYGLLERQHEFLSLLFPRAHRWRTASLCIQGAAQALEPMATLSAPLLESLSLSTSDIPAWTRDEPLDIFAGRPPPRLQELSLNRIPVLWSPKNLCNLKVLEITNIENLGPSLDQLFAILSASPGLESLSIVDVTFSGGVRVLIPNPIHMPTLGKLWLEGIPSGRINRILAAIHAPECKTGSLKPGVPLSPFEALFASDSYHFFDNIRSGVGAGYFLCSGGGVTASWEGRWNISVDMANIRMARRVLDWISVSPEPNSPAIPLHLAIEESDPLMGEDILAVMADMEAVHRVELGYYAPLVGALEILATGCWEERSARKPFPGLKEIVIVKSLDDDEWEKLLAMLRSRQRDIEARGVDHRLNPICSLKVGDDLYIEDEESFNNEFKSIHWPNRLQEVRKLLGRDGKLRWHQFIVAEDGTLEEQPREGPRGCRW